MSMVLTRLPSMLIGSDRAPACWACADCSSPQLQKTMPVAAAVVALSKLRRVVVIDVSSAVRFFLCGEGGLALRIAGDAAVPHHPRLSHVPRRGLVEQAAIVPDHRVARRPVM